MSYRQLPVGESMAAELELEQRRLDYRRAAARQRMRARVRENKARLVDEHGRVLLELDTWLAEIAEHFANGRDNS